MNKKEKSSIKSAHSSSEKAVRCKRLYRYLKDNIDFRDSRDKTARDVWWEKYHELKLNCWWHYRNFAHWLRDRDYAESQKVYGNSKKGSLVKQAFEYILKPPTSKHRPHKKKGKREGYLRGKRRLVAEGNRRYSNTSYSGLSADNYNDKEVNSIVNFVTIGNAILIELPWGQFIEIARKKVEGNENEFISMSKGEFYDKEDGTKGKRYQKNFSFGMGAKEKVVQAIEEV